MTLAGWPASDETWKVPYEAESAAVRTVLSRLRGDAPVVVVNKPDYFGEASSISTRIVQTQADTDAEIRRSEYARRLPRDTQGYPRTYGRGPPPSPTTPSGNGDTRGSASRPMATTSRAWSCSSGVCWRTARAAGTTSVARRRTRQPPDASRHEPHDNEGLQEQHKAARRPTTRHRRATSPASLGGIFPAASPA